MGGSWLSPLRIGAPGEPWAFGEPPRRTPSGGDEVMEETPGKEGLGAAWGGPWGQGLPGFPPPAVWVPGGVSGGAVRAGARLRDPRGALSLGARPPGVAPGSVLTGHRPRGAFWGQPFPPCLLSPAWSRDFGAFSADLDARCVRRCWGGLARIDSLPPLLGWERNRIWGGLGGSPGHPDPGGFPRAQHPWNGVGSGRSGSLN